MPKAKVSKAANPIVLNVNIISPLFCVQVNSGDSYYSGFDI
jgi:hypothetical protein